MSDATSKNNFVWRNNGFCNVTRFADLFESGANVDLLAWGGEVSVVVILCLSTYEPGGGTGRDDTCVVLLTERLISAGC